MQRIGQRTFEKKCGSREEFVRMFGKNYLEDKL
nr:MAG TPA: Recombination enhancement, RecA-dependent nuclease [Caudoviricetes sp.]